MNDKFIRVESLIKILYDNIKADLTDDSAQWTLNSILEHIQINPELLDYFDINLPKFISCNFSKYLEDMSIFTGINLSSINTNIFIFKSIQMCTYLTPNLYDIFTNLIFGEAGEIAACNYWKKRLDSNHIIKKDYITPRPDYDFSGTVGGRLVKFECKAYMPYNLRLDSNKKNVSYYRLYKQRGVKFIPKTWDIITICTMIKVGDKSVLRPIYFAENNTINKNGKIFASKLQYDKDWVVAKYDRVQLIKNDTETELISYETVSNMIDENVKERPKFSNSIYS